jgi:hypothetical protein
MAGASKTCNRSYVCQFTTSWSFSLGKFKKKMPSNNTTSNSVNTANNNDISISSSTFAPTDVFA